MRLFAGPNLLRRRRCNTSTRENVPGVISIPSQRAYNNQRNRENLFRRADFKPFLASQWWTFRQPRGDQKATNRPSAQSSCFFVLSPTQSLIDVTCSGTGFAMISAKQSEYRRDGNAVHRVAPFEAVPLFVVDGHQVRETSMNVCKQGAQ